MTGRCEGIAAPRLVSAQRAARKVPGRVPEHGQHHHEPQEPHASSKSAEIAMSSAQAPSTSGFRATVLKLRIIADTKSTSRSRRSGRLTTVSA